MAFFHQLIKPRFYRKEGNSVTHRKQIVNEGLTRRRFIQAGASMYNKRRRWPILLIAFISFPALALGQQLWSPSTVPVTKLVPPAHGKIPVAFIIGRSAETIDFAGPWETFYFAYRPSQSAMSMEDMELFQLYTVSDSKEPVRVSGGMRIIPDYTYADAPEPKVVVIPATSKSPEMLDWIRKVSKHTDVVMSVCIGAYRLAEAGLLSGKTATTNGGAYVDIQRKFPDVHFVRNMRWVQSDPMIFTSGSTGAGIDLALHIRRSLFRPRSRGEGRRGDELSRS